MVCLNSLNFDGLKEMTRLALHCNGSTYPKQITEYEPLIMLLARVKWLRQLRRHLRPPTAPNTLLENGIEGFLDL
jgi:hypothetical protein